MKIINLENASSAPIYRRSGRAELPPELRVPVQDYIGNIGRQQGRSSFLIAPGQDLKSEIITLCDCYLKFSGILPIHPRPQAENLRRRLRSTRGIAEEESGPANPRVRIQWIDFRIGVGITASIKKGSNDICALHGDPACREYGGATPMIEECIPLCRRQFDKIPVIRKIEF